jgi:septal ring factor EnvC (AmiA/AmiB activator)
MILRIIVLGIWLWSGVALADDDDDPTADSEMEAIRNELEARRSEYERLGREEEDQLERLRDIEEQIALSGKLIFKIEKEITRLTKGIAQKERELKRTRGTLDTKKSILYRRLRHIYMVGRKLEWTEVLLSRNPTEALSAIRQMRAIATYDRDLIQSSRELADNISESLRKLRDDRNRLNVLRVESESELRQRETALEARIRLLRKLRKDKSTVARSLETLQEDFGQMSGIFDELESKEKQESAAPEVAGLADKKGNLIWPVYGKIVRGFGVISDKRGIKLTNPGIDIEIGYGEEVKAAAAGNVIYVSWLRGYGQFIILDHGDGYYTLYANLSDISVETGDAVVAGQVIARAGDTGSLEGSKLHFEVRHKKEQLNPLEWLR